jgi:aspartate aminotransferase
LKNKKDLFMTTASVISKRASQAEDSITMAITAMAQKLRKEGHDVIGFSAGEPDFPTPKHVRDAAYAAIEAGKTLYTPASGIPELKAAVCARLLSDNGLSYAPENIVVSCGAKHSIYNALMATIDPGDEVIVPVPFWVSYPDQVSLVDGVSVYIHTTESNEFKVTPEQLKAVLTPKSKMLILNSPSNPTGSIYTKEELVALTAVILEHPNLLVLSDEIYEKLIYDEAVGHVSIATLSDEIKARTIVINGVSKAYAMTGWRIGYAAASKDIATVMGKMQSHTTSNPTTPSQWAALAALTGPDTDIDTMREAFNARRLYMVDALNAIPGIRCLAPKGAFYAFPNVSACYGKKSKSGVITDSASFCKLLLSDALVACVPGSGFGSDDFVRLSYATSMENIEKGIQRIHDWVATLV